MTKFITSQQIESSLDFKKLLKEIKFSIDDGSFSKIQAPQRLIIKDEKGSYGAMPALSDENGVFITKIATYRKENSEIGIPSVNSIVTVFDSRKGTLLFTLDGATITNIKCRAVSAIIADFCTPNDSNVLTVFGAGVQAMQQILAITAIRPITKINICSRSYNDSHLNEIRSKLSSVRVIEWCNANEQSVLDADIICTATTSDVPLIQNMCSNKNVHYSCIGKHTKFSREVSREILLNSTVIVEDLKTAIEEAGDAHKHAIGLNDLFSQDSKRLKNSPTVFSSTGHASLDLLVAKHIIQKLV